MLSEWLTRIAMIGAGAGIAAAPLAAQQPAMPLTGAISGTVIDAESLLPLTGATITLDADNPAAFPGSEGSPFLTTGRATISNPAGAYQFDGLPPGRYRLRISLLGYRANVVGVELRGSADSRLSVGLSVEPVALEPIEVRGLASDSYGRANRLEREMGGARINAARARQREHLPADVRELTHSDVVESVTLGETDLFRAFQRTPSVAARDDYGAQMWVRGAPWDQTRVYFDGVPLFNPVHGFGLLSAVNTDAIGGALLHPGVRPASVGDGAAAVLEVTSRSGRGADGIDGVADLSLASGRLALDGDALGGRGAWMVAGRRSWIDLATSAAARIAGDRELKLPYSFADLTARVDLQVGDESALELSGLMETDRITGTVPDVFHRTRARWGNTAGRVTYAAPAGAYRSRTTLGLSRYEARVRRGDQDPEGEGVFNAPAVPPSDNSLTHVSISGEVVPDRAGGRALPWRVGYGAVYERGDYRGPPGYLHGRYEPVDGDSALEMRSTLAYLTAWGERRWAAGEGITVETGFRLQGGPPVRNGGAIRLMPRLMARYARRGDLSFSAGVGRSFQYTQTLAGTGPLVGDSYAASDIWLVAGEEAPAIRSDVATFGAERWVGGDWLLGANVYARRSTGVALPDPAPGLLIDRPLFVTGRNDAHGLELSARRLAGRWTASAAYALARSEMEASGIRFPASEDRRHALDLTSMLRFGSSLRFGGAFTYASGAPFTRIEGSAGDCTPEGCGYELRAGPTNAQRSPYYASLDLLVDWTTRLRSWELGAYLQLRNALGRENTAAISSTGLTCLRYRAPDFTCIEEGYLDRFQTGLPRLPFIGFRARF